MTLADLEKDKEQAILRIYPETPEEAVRMIESVSEDTRAIFVEISDPNGWDSLEGTARLSERLSSAEVPSILCFAAPEGRIFHELVDSFDVCYIVNGSSVVSRESIVTASKAARTGIVNFTGDEDAVAYKANATAERIASLAPIAVRAGKKAVREGIKGELETGLVLESKLFSALFGTADMREGTRAFIEKRAPSFKGE